MAELRDFCSLALALHERVLPPTNAGVEVPPEGPFCGSPHSRPWIERTPRRAAMVVSTACTEAAVLLEQTAAHKYTVAPRLDACRLDELMLLQADHLGELANRLRTLTTLMRAEPLTDPRVHLRQYKATEYQPCRLAILGTSRQDFLEKLEAALTRLTSSTTGGFQTPNGIYFRHEQTPGGKTAFLFPGQGSQYLGMFGDLCIALPKLQSWFERLQDVPARYQRCPYGLLVAPPEIGLSGADRAELNRMLFAPFGGGMTSFIASLGMYNLLTEVGVRADGMMGYSNGENAALIASGTWQAGNIDQVMEIVAEVSRSDVFDATVEEEPRGASIAVNGAPAKLIDRLLTTYRDQLFLALDNCPSQVVLFGKSAAIASATSELTQTGVVCSALPFDRGHHTPLFAADSKRMRALYETFRFGRARVPLYSCMTATIFPDATDDIRRLAASQWVNTVRFRETVDRLYADGYRCFVEVGPNSHLTSFVHSILRGRPYTAVATNVSHRPGLDQFLRALGQLFVSGHAITLPE